MAFPYDDDGFYIPSMTMPDLQRRGGIARPPALTIQDLQTGGPAEAGGDVLTSQISVPGGRPEVYLRGQSLAFNVGTTPTAINVNRVSVDALIIDCPSGAANSVFFGFGNGISTSSGLEVRPGIPYVHQPDNTRELWELQRQLEYIATLMAANIGVPPLPIFRTPRVVIDLSQWFLVAAATTAINVQILYVPEQQ